MNDNVKQYHITLIPNQDKGAIMSLVSMAVRKRLPQRTKEFTAELTKEQVQMLLDTGAIQSIDDIQELEDSVKIEEQAISSKTINYIRRQQTGWPSRSTEYDKPSEAEDDIANPETATQKEHVTRSLKIKVAAMPPLGAASDSK